MLHKTRGIVLSYIKYRDTSVIVRIYTQEFGLQAYIINGIRSKSSKKSLALLQPLSLLDLVVYKKSSGGINRLSEYKSAVTFKTIPFDIKKSTIALFISEWLSKILIEEEPDHHSQFSFIFQSIECFDSLTVGVENFHLQFMIKTTNYLGFGIGDTQDLLDDKTISHLQIKEAAEHTVILGHNPYGHTIVGNHKVRRDILDLVINYYQRHIENFQEIKSAQILKDVFHP